MLTQIKLHFKCKPIVNSYCHDTISFYRFKNKFKKLPHYTKTNLITDQIVHVYNPTRF